MGSDPGYDTPVPELDDHRYLQPTTSRGERPRRGTFDSLYGSRHVESEAAQLRYTSDVSERLSLSRDIILKQMKKAVKSSGAKVKDPVQNLTNPATNAKGFVALATPDGSATRRTCSSSIARTTD